MNLHWKVRRQFKIWVSKFLWPQTIIVIFSRLQFTFLIIFTLWAQKTFLYFWLQQSGLRPCFSRRESQLLEMKFFFIDHWKSLLMVINPKEHSRNFLVGSFLFWVAALNEWITFWDGYVKLKELEAILIWPTKIQIVVLATTEPGNNA